MTKKSVLSLFFALPAVVFAQIPAAAPSEKPSAYLEVKLAGGHNSTSHINKGNPDLISNSTKQNTRTMAIAITAGTLMHAPLDAKIEWFFVAKDLKSKRELIFDGGSKDVTLKVGAPEEFEEASKPIKSSVTNETLYGMSELSPKMSGGKPDGWIVRITAGGAVVALKASASYLEDAANDPEQFQKLRKP